MKDSTKQVEKSGFTLVELIMVLVLTGILVAFSGMFLTTGIKSYIFSKNSSEEALKAQVALDRVALELRHLNEISDFAQNDFIEYKNGRSELSGTRRLKYDSGSKTLFLHVDNPVTGYILLDGIESFLLSVERQDTNGDGNVETAPAYTTDVQSITIEIDRNVNDTLLKFEKKIYPRDL